MSEIILKCINHVISVVNTPDISSGNVNYDTVLFELCPNWTGFTKTAVFYRSEDEVYYQMLDSNNRCTIPKEVLREKGKIRIGLFGVKDNKTITSDVVTYNVSQGAITTGLKPSDPTPDIYAQLIGQYINLGAEIDLERKRIDSIVAGSTADANAELRDIRIGADGTVYGSAGDAVRSQFKMIKEVNALAIANEASDKEIIVTDSSDNEFKNLKVYGETTQRLGNLIKCDASFMGNIINGITFKGEYETPIGEGELQYIEVSGKFEPLNMDGGTTASSTSRTIGEATLSAGEYIFSQGYATTSLTPYLVLYLDGVRSSDLSTVGQTEKSIKLTKSTVVRLDIEVRVASGTTITTTKVYPMIRLASETDGTYEPYNGVDPSPESPKTVRGVKGKNELDCSRLKEQTISGVKFTPVFENGFLRYVNVNGTATDKIYFSLGAISLSRNEKHILSGCPSGGSWNGYILYARQGKIGEDTGNGAILEYADDIPTTITFYVASGYTANNLKFYPMIRDASIKDGSYSPYNCVRFEETGKNLLRNNATSQTVNGITFTINNDGSVTANGTTTDRTVLILSGDNRERYLGKEVILSGCPNGGSTSTYNLQCWHYNKNNSTALDYGSGTKFTFTNDTDGFNISIIIQSGVTVNNLTFKPMIRLASITDDTYEPYKGERVNLSGIELHGLGDVKDYIDLERGVIVRKFRGKHILKSDMERFTQATNGNYICTYVLDGAKALGKCICTHFLGIDTADRIKLAHLYRCYSETDKRVYFRDTADNTLFSNATNSLAVFENNDVYLLYELETPIEEPLSASDIQALRSLHSYKPTTILTNDVGADMTLEYVADTKLYIDKRISEIATAILNN